ncbi:unnamed protein product [Chrysodeixis includens]|uniref:Cleavage and polyadenylation specificity factor subunit 4 n=1 Tax=Chrysodeixis includens TaxID=689277 RepID=A0A9P0BKU4_CHRIL|nr:unnamed protein product [Chrysodeixis includens]
MGSNSEQNGCQQNGCQPSVSQPVASTSDPLIQSASSSDQQVKVCRDYIWGICTKGTQCKFRHEFDVAMMKNVLKFCHDHQNRTGCSRPGCSYLHTTKEEENLFLTTGQIPRALAERHSAMFAAPANLYANEFVGGQAPPLPPQPQLETTAVAAATSTTGGPPPPHSFKDPKPPLPPPPASLRGLPVPPPPPPPLPLTLPPPSTRAPVPALIPPPEFIAPLPSMYGAVEPPPPLPMFDTSRPPPSLASVTLKSQTSIVIKRAAESSEAREELQFSARKKARNSKSESKLYPLFRKCHYCGRPGHSMEDCFRLKRQNINRHEVQINEQPTSYDNSGFSLTAGDYHLFNQGKEKITFLLDSGAADHTVNREDLFISYSNLETPIRLVSIKHGEYIATKVGALQLTSNMGVPTVLEAVLYCAEMPYNLLAISMIQRAGMCVIFDQDGTRICKNDITIMRGERQLPAITFQAEIPDRSRIRF